MSRSRNWIFTINNPETMLVLDESVVKACWYQEEVGENGTHHFQGYVEFIHPKSLSAIKKIDGFETGHFETRRGNQAQAIAYATKDETRVGGPYLFGRTDDLDAQGKRNDIEEFVKAVDAGLSQADSFASYPGIHARFPRFVVATYERLRVSRLVPAVWIPRPGWQSDLLETVSRPPDARKVLWYVDEVGGTGKSMFALSHPSCYVVTGGKHADIIYAYAFESVVFFDWPRDAEDRFPYSMVESFKNGYALSTKYEVRRLRFEVPHVVVFSNFQPDRTKLSADRWDIHNIRVL